MKFHHLDHLVENMTWTVCLHEIIPCVAREGRKKEMNETVKTLLNLFSKLAVEVLVDPLEERLQDQRYPQSLYSDHQSVS